MTITLGEYQARAMETAIYPREYALVYPALKLAGEAGEIAGKIADALALAWRYFQALAAQFDLGEAGRRAARDALGGDGDAR